jgi:hypothetical protein
LLRAEVAAVSGRVMDAAPLLLKAARHVEPVDPGTARETYLEALGAVLGAGRLAVGGGVREVAEAARWAPPAPQPARGPDLLLDGLALLITEGYPAGVPALKRALRAFCGGRISDVEGLRWLWPVINVAVILWDCEAWHLLAARQLGVARDAGALVVLPFALITLSPVLILRGDFVAAAALITEAEEINEATGNPFYLEPYAALHLAAWQGDEATARALIEASLPMAWPRGEGNALVSIGWASAGLARRAAHPAMSGCGSAEG